MADTPLPTNDEERCHLALSGLPDRATAWPQLLGARELRRSEPADYIDELLLRADESPTRLDHLIWLSLSKTGHRYFDSASARMTLRNVLAAYARRCPGLQITRQSATGEATMCEPLLFVAARLVFIVKNMETAFWCLAAVLETMPGLAVVLSKNHRHSVRLVKVGWSMVQVASDDLHQNMRRSCPAMFTGSGAATLKFYGAALGAMLVAPSGALASQSSLRIMDALLLLGDFALHCLGVAWFAERAAQLMQLTEWDLVQTLAGVDQQVIEELDEAALGRLTKAALGAGAGRLDIVRQGEQRIPQPAGSVRVLGLRPARWAPDNDRLWPSEQRLVVRTLLLLHGRGAIGCLLGKLPRDVLLYELVPRVLELQGQREIWRVLASPDAPWRPALPRAEGAQRRAVEPSQARNRARPSPVGTTQECLACE